MGTLRPVPMGSPHTCLPEAAVGAGHLRERGRVGSSSMNIDLQSFHTFVGLPIGRFNDLQISMIPKGGVLNISGDVEQQLMFFM